MFFLIFIKNSECDLTVFVFVKNDNDQIRRFSGLLIEPSVDNDNLCAANSDDRQLLRRTSHWWPITKLSFPTLPIDSDNQMHISLDQFKYYHFTYMVEKLFCQN
jgi:hypothetical protein